MNKKITFVLVLAIVALMVMGSASAGLFDFLGGGSSETVKIGYLPSDHDAALFVADQQGYFEDKNISIGELLHDVIPEDEEEDFHKNMDKFMKQEIHRVINRTQIAELVSKETAKIIKEKAGTGLASKVLGGGRTAAISDYVGKHMQGFAKEQADTLILRIVREETANAFAQPISGHLEELNIPQEQVKIIIRRAYERFMKDYIMDVVKVFDIATLTERKIIEFKSEEIEEIVNLTIKSEMQAVVNLGAFIGVVIGFVNSFINTL